MFQDVPITFLWHFAASSIGTYLCLAIRSGHSSYLNSYLNKEMGGVNMLNDALKNPAACGRGPENGHVS